jgi:NAD(P)-dependent dehydrogenase (short-subunit alcohol dehydrogenase family)
MNETCLITGGARGIAIARMMQLNVIGLMLCCREAARRMSTAHGGFLIGAP